MIKLSHALALTIVTCTEQMTDYFKSENDSDYSLLECILLNYYGSVTIKMMVLEY